MTDLPSEPEPSGNRLALESSPYLLQHADQPVHWFAWGPDAFAAAAERNCPIFLSVGYSACHWCHVMAHESFDDEEIAALMNAYFVNVKVDREERPDVDQIYMQAVIAQSGSGGWPMSVFLTPDGKPFLGGTYWPPETRHGRAGFRDIVRMVHESWRTHHAEILNRAEELTRAVIRLGRPHAAPVSLSEDLLQRARQALLEGADRHNGGFGAAPKFPHPLEMRLLLRLATRFSDEDCAHVALVTLDRMQDGGIFDHIGGGFHRYSTDARWLVPHFEKMLYDNALLVPAYLEAFQYTSNRAYRETAIRTLEFVLQEMQSSAGGYFAAQDADSEGVEGRFYVWESAAIDAALGEQFCDADVRLFKDVYGVTDAGNWEGQCILNRTRSSDELVELTPDEDERLQQMRAALMRVREDRVRPARDEKVITSWSALMAGAMAFAGRVLDDSRYVESATRAIDFLLNQVSDQDGRLLHCRKDGRPRFNAFLDDYANTVDALIEVFQATGHGRYVDEAVRLATVMIDSFAADDGGFYYTSHDHETLIARNKDFQDGAVPSGNGMAAWALLRLAQLTGENTYRSAAQETLDVTSGIAERAPLACGQSLLALDYWLGPTTEIAFGGELPRLRGLQRTVAARFLPRSLVVSGAHASLPTAIPAEAVESEAVVRICQDSVCRAPLTSVGELEDILDELEQ